MGHVNQRYTAVLILLLAASLARAGQSLLPVPSADEQAADRPTVGQLFADELSSGRREDDIDVAKKLINQSYRRPISPAVHYLMLIESRNLAVTGHDLNTADIACWELAQNFDVSLAAARVEMLQAAVSLMTSQEESASLVSVTLRAIDDALLRDEFEPVDQLMKLAMEALRTAASPELARALSVRKGQLTLQRAEYKTVAPQRAALSAHPNDPAANLK